MPFLRDNVEKYVRTGLATRETWRIRIAYWIPKVTKTHSKYVIHFAFPLQQWLRECTSLLRNTYIIRLVITWRYMFMDTRMQYRVPNITCMKSTRQISASYADKDYKNCRIYGNYRKVWVFSAIYDAEFNVITKRCWGVWLLTKAQIFHANVQQGIVKSKQKQLQ